MKKRWWSLILFLPISLSMSTSKLPRVAIAQLRTTNNKLSNLLDVARLAGEARRSKESAMLFLPECFGFLGESSAQTLEQAEPTLSLEPAPENHQSVTDVLREAVAGRGKTAEEGAFTSTGPISLFDGVKTIARESRLWISGTMHTQVPRTSDEEKPRVFNTHFVIDNQGTLQATYNKIHLFDVSIPGKVNLCESATTAAGTELVVCDSPIGKLGLSTCYDVRFPEVYLELVKRGAQVLLVPSAFTVPTGTAHWHTLLRGKINIHIGYPVNILTHVSSASTSY
jgi:predicted amidohydrolase